MSDPIKNKKIEMLFYNIKVINHPSNVIKPFKLLQTLTTLFKTNPYQQHVFRSKQNRHQSAQQIVLQSMCRRKKAHIHHHFAQCAEFEKWGNHLPDVARAILQEMWEKWSHRVSLQTCSSTIDRRSLG